MVSAIIQARMGSSRFPGKTMKEIMGKPMLWHIVNRVRAAKSLDDIIIVTTDNKEDNTIESFADKFDIKCWRDNENDVLNLFYQSAKKYNIDTIVRITADDPFKDPNIIDFGLSVYNNFEGDYVSNCSYDGSIKPTYPEGLDIEILSFNCLQKIWGNAKIPSEREHVTPYLFNNSKDFKIKGFYNSENLSKLRWTVDYEKDFEFVLEIYERLYPYKNIFVMEDILNLLNKEPNLKKINSGIIRHEGYYISVDREKKI